MIADARRPFCGQISYPKCPPDKDRQKKANREKTITSSNPASLKLATANSEVVRANRYITSALNQNERFDESYFKFSADREASIRSMKTILRMRNFRRKEET